jgi:hypothetical protein
MEQTRFRTVPTGVEVLRELQLDERPRAVEGECFSLGLWVETSLNDTVQKDVLTLYVDRLPVGHFDEHINPHPNGDDDIRTMATIIPGSEQFEISIFLERGKAQRDGALVRVSTNMETIILRYLEQHDKGA